MIRPIAIAAAIVMAGASVAQDITDHMVRYPAEGNFDDTVFALENAIIARGLVVDHVSHTGEMLERTGQDLGATETLFDAADVYMFCSASLSRKVMQADPWNVVHCPYTIFVADRDGAVSVGFRNYPEGPMKEVQALLDAIAQEAAAGF